MIIKLEYRANAEDLADCDATMPDYIETATSIEQAEEALARMSNYITRRVEDVNIVEPNDF